MKEIKIVNVKGYQMLDSRSNPTVAARVVLSDQSEGFALCPSGASTGRFEAVELRDKNPSVYNGKSVMGAVKNINEVISKALCGQDAFNQQDIDRLLCALDGTENKSQLGANAILAVSLAAARAAAASVKLPLYRYLGGAQGNLLPVPMMNILNGGAHAANNIDIQEFMIVPYKAHTFEEAMRVGTEVYHSLKKSIESKHLSSAVGDEGGFAPNLDSDEEAIELILDAAQKCGHLDNIKIALDCATSEWYGQGGYTMPKRQLCYNAKQLADYWERLCDKYPIISIEDGMAEDDFEGWRALTQRLGERIQLVGDDLFVTNQNRFEFGVENGCANAILIKPNQIGTLSETIQVTVNARNRGYKTIMSHRSGETEDAFIADLAVALNCGQIKTGAPCRSERVAKYNRLLMIEHQLNKNDTLSVSF